MYQKQVKKLSGLNLRGPLEPTDSLVDTYASMYEQNRIRFVPAKGVESKPSDEKKPASSSRSAPYSSGSPSKSKGKGKSKNKGSEARFPAILLEGGCRARTNKGDPICFGFNLGSCSLPVTNGPCEKGYRVCALPRCGKHHPYVQCPMKGGAS